MFLEVVCTLCCSDHHAELLSFLHPTLEIHWLGVLFRLLLLVSLWVARFQLTTGIGLILDTAHGQLRGEAPSKRGEFLIMEKRFGLTSYVSIFFGIGLFACWW